MRYLTLLLALLAAPALAAVPTVIVTGQVLDPGLNAPKKGTVTCKLNVPATSADGTLVANETTWVLTASGGLPDGAALVPNDALYPTGTRYTCTISAVLANGRPTSVAVQKQLASSPASQTFGSIPNPQWPLAVASPAAAPMFSPAPSGTYAAGQMGTMSAYSPGSALYYVTDGSSPTTASTLYSGPYTISGGVRAIATAPGFTTSPVASANYTIGATALSLPWTSSGQLLPEPAGTVCHVWWDGSQIQDTKGCPWSQVGTVAQGTSPFYPSGFGGAPRGSISGTSSTKYFQSPSASDAMDFAGDWYGFAVFQAPPIAGSAVLYSNDSFGASGYTLLSNGSGQLLFAYQGSGVANGGTMSVAAITTACFGVTGTTSYMRLNDGASVTASVPTHAPATTASAKIGWEPTYAVGWPTAHYELLFVGGTGPTDALCSTLHQAAVGSRDASGIGLTFLRSSTSTLTVGGSTYTLSANIPRLDGNGLAFSAGESLATQPIGYLGGPIGAGVLRWRPSIASSVGGASRPLLGSGNFLLRWNAASTALEVVAGGVTATSSTQSFAADARTISIGWRYVVGDRVCVSVDGAETCRVGPVAPILPGALLYVGSDAAGGVADGRISGLAFIQSPSAWRASYEVVTSGDSMTNGFYPYLASRMKRPTTVYNLGVSGYTVDQIKVAWDAFGITRHPGWMTIMGGHNSLKAGATGAATWATMLSQIQGALADGIRVVLMTCPPSSSFTAGQRTELAALNSAIRSYCLSGVAGVKCVDVHALVSNGADAILPAYDNGDQVHLNATGSDLVAAAVQAQML